MKQRKVLVYAGVLLGMILSCTACGREVQQTEETSEQKVTTFDWYVNLAWFQSNWGENMVSRQITKDTGVSINFMTPSGTESEKLSALINSDSLPDIITLGWWESEISEMLDGGKIYPLNELADKYDKDFWKVADEDAVSWYTNEDGNLYCYPNFFYTPQNFKEHKDIASNETFLVRKDIYEAIGSPDMSTKEGFERAVKKAAELFPEVDGKPLIPIGAHVFDNQGCVSFDKYLQNFLAVPYEKNGKVYDRYTDGEYLDWLKVFRKLGQEGYLKPDIFVDTRTQMEEKIEQGRYFCMLYQYTDIVDQQKKLMVENPDRIYIAVDGPQNSKGDDPELPVVGINGWTVTLITKNCKNPEKAIQFMEYMLSEKGQKMMYFGVEGEMYDEVDGEPVVKEEVEKLLNTNRIEYDRVYGGNDMYWMLGNYQMRFDWKRSEPAEILQMKEWTYPYTIYNGQYDSIRIEDAKVAKANDQLTKLWSETLPKLLLAKSDAAFEQQMEEYVRERKSLGYESVMAEKTRLVKEAKEKLGIE